jgi:hypothetical protein
MLQQVEHPVEANAGAEQRTKVKFGSHPHILRTKQRGHERRRRSRHPHQTPFERPAAKIYGILTTPFKTPSSDTRDGIQSRRTYPPAHSKAEAVQPWAG